jgi:soluble cytochrome b562
MRAGSAERAAERRKLVTDLEADRAALADAITQVEKSEQELAANITELRKRYPEGIPPTVVDLLDKHKQLLKGLSPDQLNDVIKNSMNLPA